MLVPVLSHAAPVTLILTNGDRLQGDLLERNQESLTIKHQLLGEMVINTNTVSEIKTDYDALAQQTPTDETPIIEPADLAEAEPEDNGLLGTGWLTNWERRFDLGLAGSRGNLITVRLMLHLMLTWQPKKPGLTAERHIIMLSPKRKLQTTVFSLQLTATGCNLRHHGSCLLVGDWTSINSKITTIGSMQTLVMVMNLQILMIGYSLDVPVRVLTERLVGNVKNLPLKDC